MTLPLKDRSAIITGANQGLGFAIAKAYIEAGAHVLLCAREGNLLEQAHEELLTLAPEPQQKIIAHSCDVAQPDQVKEIVTLAFNHFGALQILVNNAGVYGPIGLSEEVDWQAWKQAIEINLMGSVLMSRAVLPHFKQHRYGKIIQLSGGGATNPIPRSSAYAASKAAIVRFAETLAEEVRDDHIDVNSIAPGALNTRILDQVLMAGPEQAGKNFYERMAKVKEEGGVPLARGAALAVFLGSAHSDGLTGKLISAVWDDWQNFPQHTDDLQKTDVYTLRRIVPKDRGLKWGV